MRNLHLGLGPKLNLSLLTFMLVLMAATAALVLFGFKRTQDTAAERSRQALEQQGLVRLDAYTQEQAYIGELQLFPATEWGHQAARYMVLADFESPGSHSEPELTLHDDGAWFDDNPRRLTDVVVPGGVPIDDAVMRDLRESSPLNGLFPSLMADYAGRLTDYSFRPIAVYYIGTSGATRYYPPHSDLVDQLANISAADIQRVMVSMSREQNPEGRTIWSTPYEDEAGRGLVITAYTPVYSGTELRGAIGVDVSMARLISQIDSIRPTESGFAFYIDAGGTMLDTTARPLLQAELASGENPALAQVVAAMEAGQTGVARVELDDREQFFAYAPLPNVGGSFALAAPVEEITEQAAAVSTAIENEGERTVGFVLLTMVLLFVGALGGTAYLNRRVLLRPIEALVTGTRAVAGGNFNATIPVRSTDELGDLAVSFNRMIGEVRTRNEALQREIAERERTTLALAEREEGFRNIFESTHDSLFISDMGDRIVDANPAAIQMHGYSLEELRKLSPFDLIHPSSRPAADMFLEELAAGRTYRSRLLEVRKDGSTFTADVVATNIMYQGSMHVLSVTRDVTEEVEQQHLLERRVEERTRELRALLGVSQNVAATLDPDELLRLVLEQVQDVVPYSGASILILEGTSLVTRYARAGDVTSDSETSNIQRFPVSGLVETWPILRSGRPVIVGNVRGDAAFAKDFRWLAGPLLETTFARVISWLVLPMVQKGRFIGMIGLSADRPNAFGDREADLGMAIANQAAVALDNARLFAEAERRAQEMTALSRVATSLDLERSLKGTLDILAQRIVESTNAMGATVSTVASDGSLKMGGTYGLPEGFLEAVAAGHRRGAPRPNQNALQSGKPFVLRNARQRTMQEPLYLELQEISRDAEWDHVVILPMRFGDRDLGTIETYYRDGEQPDEREIALVFAMARQAAAAIENALLFDQTEKRVRQLEALTRIASSFTLEHSLERLMDDIAREILRASTARFTTITLTDGVARPKLVAMAGQPDEFREALQDAYDAGASSAATRAITERRTLLLHDIRKERVEDPRYAPAKRFFEDQSWDSVIVVPIVYGERGLGVVTSAYPAERDPEPEEVSFLEAIADQAALAIENARLYQRASAAAALEERQRLARELHDSVSQALYGIALGARTARRRLGDDAPNTVAEPLDYVLSLAEAGLTEMRALIFELRPESIATEGLVAAIGRQVAATQARYGITVNASLCDEPDVAIETKEAVYRIAQESLHNTVKHARATSVDVSLAREEGNLVLVVRDNGQGFDPTGEFPGHLGLRSMRERASGVGGTFTIDSEPSVGTSVRLHVPYSR